MNRIDIYYKDRQIQNYRDHIRSGLLIRSSSGVIENKNILFMGWSDRSMRTGIIGYGSMGKMLLKNSANQAG